MHPKKLLNLAVSRAREVVTASSADEIPVSLPAIADHLLVSEISPRQMSAEGYVGRNATGELVIRYRPSSSPERIRFTIAHELAHLIIADVEGIDITAPKHRGGQEVEEYIANRLASEILMPEAIFKMNLKKRKVSWPAINEIKSCFGVSLTAFLRRLLEIPELPAIWARMSLDGENTNEESFCCKTSNNASLRFTNPVAVELERVQRETMSGKSCNLVVEIQGSKRLISCIGRTMSKFIKQEYWIIGWECDIKSPAL